MADMGDRFVMASMTWLPKPCCTASPVGDVFSAPQRTNRCRTLAIARALLMNPRYVIMDEPSEGLASVIVDHLVDALRTLCDDGIGLLLTEQKLAMALAVCARVAIMMNGRIAASMPAAQLASDEGAQQRYLGVAAH
ncbi:MAG TPA: hypothetical protein VGU24_22040 [Microvirga sp.]|jgi:ABC-type branched-subunit amino acid transport system ATPase component|nr:hypothetical protein [Microvirga sp.]